MIKRDLISSGIHWRFARRLILTKPSGVISVDARPPGVSLLSTINHDGLFCDDRQMGKFFVSMLPQATYDLVQALRSTKTGWASANDEDVNVAEGKSQSFMSRN